jgi:tetratricopeptide (TPR) repeat protein
MSDVFYEAMKKQGLFTISREKEMGFPRLLHEMPVTIVDSLAAVYRMFNLRRSWPFRQPAGKDGLPGLRDILLALHDTVTSGAREKELAYNLAYKKESWEDVMAELYEYYIGNKDLVNAGKVMGGLALEHPAEEAYYEKAANVYGKGKDLENAVFYFRKAFTLAPGFDKARHLFVIYLQLDRPADAIPFLDWAIQNNASGMQLGPVRQLAVEVIQLQKGLARDSSNLPILNQIAAKYFEMGNKEGGVQYANKVLRIDPGNKEALSLLARFTK